MNINARTKAELPRDRLKIHVAECEQKTHLDFPPFLVSVGIEEFVKNTAFVQLSCSSAC